MGVGVPLGTTTPLATPISAENAGGGLLGLEVDADAVGKVTLAYSVVQLLSL